LEKLLQQYEVIWFLVGLVLLLLELAVPGLIVMFFGVGAWVTALACLFFDIGINTQLLIFLITSVSSLGLLRGWLRKRYGRADKEKTGSGNIEEDYIGKTAIALQSFAAGQKGKVSFHGTDWDAISDQPVTAGEQVIITGYKSIQLFVQPLHTTI
jgi:membrane protein implicated in regulation of membrane protease activity